MDLLPEIVRIRLTRQSEALCESRNANLPAELGKAQFDTLSDGVMFSKAHYLCDSMHVDYVSPVAKVTWVAELNRWRIYMPQSLDNSEKVVWVTYPFLPTSDELSIVLHELEKDPQESFWSA
ncbi:DUF3024 domain-containing protein [Vibrio maerlii]|uniref:DUF3024 domain-containing protein n=1 Tax=Vibrio maerlii TaxID=2231648 RepID=UPI000E3BF36F|nr:DUF3024 domain-containing protein [Vibrio maerlii]